VSDSSGLQGKSNKETRKQNTSGMAVLISARKFTALSNHDLETELNDTEAFQYLAVTLPQKRKPVWCIKSADSTQAANVSPSHSSIEIPGLSKFRFAKR
jgi:preprotein translocase subunit Sec63